MPCVKKIVYPFLVFSVLLLAGCGSGNNVYQPEPNGDYANEENTNGEYISPHEPEPMPEDINDKYLNPYEPEPIAENANGEYPATHKQEPLSECTISTSSLLSASTWAKTPEYFFFTRIRRTSTTDSDGEIEHNMEYMLYRVPLEDITQGERIIVPGDGEIEIVGVCEQFLYVSRKSGDWFERHYETHMVCLTTLEASWLDWGTYYGVPRFHQASNSILFAHGCLDEMVVWLEALKIDTGMRHGIYKFESENFDSFGMGWWQLDNGNIVFINSSWGGAEWGSDFILIDAGLKAAQVQRHEISTDSPQDPQPQSSIEELIFELGLWWWPERRAIVEDWLFYLLPVDEWGMRFSLYRINLDGTGESLLDGNSDIVSLLGLNNILLATMYAHIERGPGDDIDWHEAVKLSHDGDVLKVLGAGWDGHNSAFGMRRLVDTDLVMIKDFGFFAVDGWVQGLYCTRTGALFSLRV